MLKLVWSIFNFIFTKEKVYFLIIFFSDEIKQFFCKIEPQKIYFKHLIHVFDV